MSTPIPASPVLQSPSRENPNRERFLFSGHQTFALRIPWLTKAADAIDRKLNPFSDVREGVQMLGIGKNMVEALRCWVELYNVAAIDSKTGTPVFTDFGNRVFGARGEDRFLEDEQTLWLLHWFACTNTARRFFAWHWVFNFHNEREFTYDEALRAFKEESETYARPLSEVTLKQHLDVFLSTYVASSAPVTGSLPEDLLDSPLAALHLIKEGEVRYSAAGKEQVYSIDTGGKHAISDSLFRFCVHDWWQRFHTTEETVSYRQLCHGEHSPGRIFRIPEREIHERVFRLADEFPAEFSVKESHNQRQLHRKLPSSRASTMMKDIYQRAK